MFARPTTLAQHILPHSHPFIRTMLLVAAGTALMALCAQISFYLPWNPLVPITMQTFGVLLIGALYGPRLGALTMVAYLLEGLAGMPVFSAGRSAWSPSSVPGLPVILGPTAGYLYSCPLAATLVGWLATRGWDRQIHSALPAMLLGNAVILIAGFGWLAAATAWMTGAQDLTALLGAAVVPFLPGDMLKILLAALALPGGWALVKRFNG